ncbi:MAG: chromosome segregation protein SMC [Candidatus Methanomethylophilaceae archaeon]
MYLKQVEMENFKSFGGKITVPLMEGYLAITGPNGSGKSNITDAILFVLGPKSSKAIRAGKLTDLMFDGGQSKNKSDFTKVSLVFDNTDRMLPWNSDIVKLTRHVKMASNGEDYTSSFYINDQRSTMGEFDTLLTKARISAEGYNMVQQGDVTRIVQMGSLERRRVLDDISGIASYDADINKANTEKTEAETNLDRISIVIEELDKQIHQLQKDMESAKKYLEAQSRQEMAKAQLVYRTLESQESELQYTQEQILAKDQEIQVLSERKEALKAKIVELTQTIRDRENEIAAKVGPEYLELKTKIENVKVDMATLNDRIERSVDDKNEKEEELVILEEAKKESDSDLRNCVDQITENEMVLANKNEALESAKTESARLGTEMSSRGGEHTELQNKLTGLEEGIEKIGAEERDAKVNSATAESSEEEASRAVASLEEQANSVSFEIKDAEWNLSKMKEEAGPLADVSTFTNKILAMKREEAGLEKQEEDLNSAISRLTEDYSHLAAEKKVTERMSRGNDATTAVLEMRDKGTLKGIYGTIMELATVNPDYETALSIAAGSKMQAIIVEDDQVAADAMAILKKGDIGRATFLPLNKMIEGKPRARAIMTVKEAVGYAIDLIDFKEQYRSAFWYVFGDTIVVDNLTEARRLMGGVRLVTKGGELLEASGAMVGGNVGRQNLKFGAASQSRLDEVSKELRAANDALDALREQLRKLRDDTRAMDNQMRTAGAGNMEMRGTLGKLEGQLNALRENKKKLSAELVVKKTELEEAKKLRIDADAEQVQKAAELEKLKAERAKIRNRIAEIAPAELAQKIETARNSVYKLSSEVSELINIKAALNAERSGHDNQIASIVSDMAKIKKKIAEDIETIEKSDAKAKEKKIELDALRTIEAKMESGIQGLRDAKDAAVEGKAKAEAQRDSTTEKIQTTTGFRQTLDAKVIIINETIAQLKVEIGEIKIEVERPIPSEEEIKRTLRSCETVIARIGTVNLRAIEDYDEKKARYDSLTADVEKLNAQIKELTELTDSLSAQKKGLFMAVYNGVHENFKDIYAELSGGGEAYMRLEDEEDPFTGGLFINAKPRNGKLLRLEALSGGEKSLTALAFIFAIQEYQPSPFYVLDEVDMFLDSINAEMVAKRVKKSSEKAQFVQVSLRKVTLTLADHLIGVTRQPNGVSKVVMQPDLAEVSKYESEALKKQKEQQKE